MNKLLKAIVIFCCGLLIYNILISIRLFKSEDARLFVLAGIILSFIVVVGCVYSLIYDSEVRGKKGFIFLISAPLFYYWILTQHDYTPYHPMTKNIYLIVSIILCVISFLIVDKYDKPHIFFKMLESKSFTLLMCVCIGYLCTTFGTRVFLYSLTDKPIRVEDCVNGVYFTGTKNNTYVTIDYDFYDGTIKSTKCNAANFEYSVNNTIMSTHTIMSVGGLSEGDIIRIKMVPTNRILNMEYEESELVVEVKDRPEIIKEYTSEIDSHLKEIISTIYPELLNKELTMVFYKEGSNSVLSFFINYNGEIREYGIVNLYKNLDGNFGYEKRKYIEYHEAELLGEVDVVKNKKYDVLKEELYYGE